MMIFMIATSTPKMTEVKVAMIPIMIIIRKRRGRKPKAAEGDTAKEALEEKAKAAVV